jgi:hypothetical protein
MCYHYQIVSSSAHVLHWRVLLVVATSLVGHSGATRYTSDPVLNHAWGERSI